MHLPVLPRRPLGELASRTFGILAREGWAGLGRRLVGIARQTIETYPRWIRTYDVLSERDRANIKAEIGAWPSRPVISVIALGKPDQTTRLAATITALQSQLYPYWELLVGETEGESTASRSLDTWAGADSRIKPVPSGGSAAGGADAINKAVAVAAGEFVTFIEPGDVLSEHALYKVASAIMKYPDADLVNSDEDTIDASGRRSAPWFKTEWNPALMLAQAAFGRLAVLRKCLVERVGSFRPEARESLEHDLILRCALETAPSRIRHIPYVLYHRHDANAPALLRQRRRIEPPTPDRRVIEEHLLRAGIRAAVRLNSKARLEIDYELGTAPQVTILVPSTGNPALLNRCLQSILQRTTYRNFDVLVLVNEAQRQNPAHEAFLSQAQRWENIKVLFYEDRPFNYSWTNNWGARQASGEILCLLNDDTEIITPDWLEKFAARLALPGVGAVGPMMYYPDETIQHAGVILGLHGVAGHAFHREPRGSAGYAGRALVEQDLSCVSAACLALRRDVYLEIGGFDEALAIAFNDVDLCMRLRATGRRILWTPSVELYHHESTSLGRHDSPARAEQFAKEVAVMRKRWAELLDTDPYYSPNLSLNNPFRLAFPPRT